MTKVAHTPGPWTIIPAVEYDGDDENCVGSYTSPASIEGSDGNPVCAFGIAEGSGDLFENEADYRLIAAAPELLEALKGLIRFRNWELAEGGVTPADLVNVWKDAETAIAKAEIAS